MNPRGKEPLVAIGSRLARFDGFITLGARPNLADYPSEHLALIRRARRIFYPTSAFAAQLTSMGKRIFPSLECHLYAGDKIQQTILLGLLDLPHPRTRIFYGRQREKIREHFGFPLVAKTPRNSARGEGVFLINDQGELDDYLKAHKVAYIQERLPIDRDVRVVVVNFEPVCAYWRLAPPGEHRSNLAVGGVMDPNGVPPAAVELAVEAARLANLDEVGVDVAMAGGGPLILEFNMKYGHRGPAKLGVDIPAHVAGLAMRGDI